MPAAGITGTGVRREEEGTGTITPMVGMRSVEIIAGRIGPQGRPEGVAGVASWSHRGFLSQGVVPSPPLMAGQGADSGYLQ